MGSFISEAGPLIWPVIILGGAALFAAIRYASTGGRGLRSFAISTTLTAMAAGALNMLGGLHMSLSPLPRMAADERWIFLQGFNESLNGMIVALFFAVLVGLAISVGGLRFEGGQKQALEDATAGT